MKGLAVFSVVLLLAVLGLAQDVDCHVTGQTTRQTNNLMTGIQYCDDNSEVYWITPGCVITHQEYNAILQGEMDVATHAADLCSKGQLQKTPKSPDQIMHKYPSVQLCMNAPCA